MFPLLKKGSGHYKNSLPFFSDLINHCFSLKSFNFSRIVHAQLIKVGLNTHTLLGSRCLDLYTRVGSAIDVVKAFADIDTKNAIAWNICLKGLLKLGHFRRACQLFVEMPERDVVSWNSMISGLSSHGFVDHAFDLFAEMQGDGVKADEVTYTIITSFACSARHAKQIHACVLRNGFILSNVVLGNSLIDLYGKLGLADYAFGVFFTMGDWDVISWNSLIFGCHKSGHGEFGLQYFQMMRASGFSPDHYTMSTVIAGCSCLQALELGTLVFVLCIKMGFLFNTKVSSALIDLFSKCDKLGDSVQLFNEIGIWDSTLSNSMISGYACHGAAEDALQHFAAMLREEAKPTEFTLSCAANSASLLVPVEQGCQIHSLTLKLGWESDSVVASSLMDMYAKFGLVDCTTKIFCKLAARDLISWNTLIMGLACNGRVFETMDAFKEMLEEGSRVPDRLTLAGVLLACSYGGLVDQGMGLFSSLEKDYGVEPTEEHFCCVIDMLCRAGIIKEAMELIESKVYEPTASVWALMLEASVIHGDVFVAERVAEKLMQLNPQSSLPYIALSLIYEMRGRWESVVRVKKDMKERAFKKVIGSSWIGVRNHVVVYSGDQVHHQGDKSVQLMLRLLMHDMKVQGYICDCNKTGSEAKESEE